MKHIIWFIVIILITCVWVQAEEPYTITWSHQFGSSSGGCAYGVAVDADDNVYTAGVSGSIFPSDAGDVYLNKYDNAGNLLWNRELSSQYGRDVAFGVTVDAFGNAFITGETEGSLGGATYAGGYSDAFLAKYDPSGNLLWTQQVGPLSDRAYSVATDGMGNAYITGYNSNLSGTYEGIFLTKFDPSGNFLWNQQLNTSLPDYSHSVTVDNAGNAYITGYSRGSLCGTSAGNFDVFLIKYDPSGAMLWSEQIGTSFDDESVDVAIDGNGDVYITGYGSGVFGETTYCGNDAFLAKYDASGSQIWIQQFGSSGPEGAQSLAIDQNDCVFIAGTTYGDLAGANAGSGDIFLTKFDATGNQLWTTQFGTEELDANCGLAVDSMGNPFVSGYTRGEMFGPQITSLDAYIVKFAVPEPATLFLLSLGGAAILRKRKR
ncbi:MAG: SBBP repeat-containing protein [Sedimentisphaerales bacterium]|nr:SBBP repeat-containing protein [Sedimentisphaerales bacterium]